MPFHVPRSPSDAPFEPYVASRNASIRVLADVTGRALMFLLVLAAQRTLGPIDYGHATFALAVGLVLATVTDLGLPLVVTRQIARHRVSAARIAGTGLAIKAAIAIPAMAAIAMASLGRPAGSRLPTLALGAAAVAVSFVEFIGYVLRGLDHVHQEALLLLGLRATALVAGTWALWSGHGLAGFAIAYLASALLALAAGAAWLTRRHVTPVIRVDPEARRELLAQALPLAGATILSVGYLRTGVFVLDAVRGPAAVGIFGVAQKLTEPLALVPAALLATTFPSISRSHTAPRAARSARTWTLWILVGAGLLVATVGVALAPFIVRLLYDEAYGDAVPPLQILALAVLPVYVNFALTHFLVAEGRTHLNLAFNAVVFVFNLALCLALVESQGTVGVAVAALASEIVLFACCGFALRRSRLRRPGGRQ